VNQTTGSDNVYVAHEGVAAESGAIYLGTAGTHTKTVLAGNVGIGTAAPAAKLDVNGGLSVHGPFTSYDGGIRIEFNDLLLRDNYGLSSTGMRWLAFNAGSNQATFNSNLTVSNALAVSGGTTLAGGATVTSGGLQIEFNDLRLRDNYGLSSVGTRWLAFNAGSLMATFNSGLNVAGNLGVGVAAPAYPLQMASGAYVSAGGVWTNASSRALKTGIADLSTGAALQTFEQLKPVTFEYTASPGETHVGFIAEDVPDLVATRDRKSLAAMDIVAVLTKVAQEQQRTTQEQQRTIQEQRHDLAAQAARLATQDTRMADMSARLAHLEALVLALKDGDRR
jgi:hypothetical protein